MFRSAVSLDDTASFLLRWLDEPTQVAPDGAIIHIRAQIARLESLRIEIRLREHAPPHFHVMAPGIDASFAIEDCRLIADNVDGGTQRKIEVWFRGSRAVLVRTWNTTRPSDCPVGPIAEGSGGHAA